MNFALLRSSESHQFETYWWSVWPRVGLPTSDQVNLRRLPGGLSDFVLEGAFMPGPEPVLTITHVGQGIQDTLNADITGGSYFPTVQEKDRALVIRVFEAMIAQPCGRWRIMHYGFERGIRLPMDTTFFPYRSAETGGVMIGALIMPLDDAAPSGLAGRALTASAGESAQWINMGAGVPADPMLA